MGLTTSVCDLSLRCPTKTLTVTVWPATNGVSVPRTRQCAPAGREPGSEQALGADLERRRGGRHGGWGRRRRRGLGVGARRKAEGDGRQPGHAHARSSRAGARHAAAAFNRGDRATGSITASTAATAREHQDRDLPRPALRDAKRQRVVKACRIDARESATPSTSREGRASIRSTASGTRNSSPCRRRGWRRRSAPVSERGGPRRRSARRSAVKQKPRKKNSSAIGATKHDEDRDGGEREVLESSAPSSSGRPSFSVMPSAAAQTPRRVGARPRRAEPADRGPQARAPQAELARRRARARERARCSSAETISPRSWTSVPADRHARAAGRRRSTSTAREHGRRRDERRPRRSRRTVRSSPRTAPRPASRAARPPRRPARAAGARCTPSGSSGRAGGEPGCS